MQVQRRSNSAHDNRTVQGNPFGASTPGPIQRNQQQQQQHFPPNMNNYHNSNYANNNVTWSAPRPQQDGQRHMIPQVQQQQQQQYQQRSGGPQMVPPQFQHPQRQNPNMPPPNHVQRPPNNNNNGPIKQNPLVAFEQRNMNVYNNSNNNHNNYHQNPTGTSGPQQFQRSQQPQQQQIPQQQIPQQQIPPRRQVSQGTSPIRFRSSNHSEGCQTEKVEIRPIKKYSSISVQTDYESPQNLFLKMITAEEEVTRIEITSECRRDWLNIVQLHEEAQKKLLEIEQFRMMGMQETAARNHLVLFECRQWQTLIHHVNESFAEVSMFSMLSPRRRSNSGTAPSSPVHEQRGGGNDVNGDKREVGTFSYHPVQQPHQRLISPTPTTTTDWLSYGGNGTAPKPRNATNTYFQPPKKTPPKINPKKSSLLLYFPSYVSDARKNEPIQNDNNIVGGHTNVGRRTPPPPPNRSVSTYSIPPSNSEVTSPLPHVRLSTESLRDQCFREMDRRQNNLSYL